MEEIKRIAIAGCGGIGSHLAEKFCEFETRGQLDDLDYEITIFDNDTIDVSNLLHQNFTEEDLGQPKVKVLADRYCIDHAESRFMEKKDFKNFDLVFCAVDNMEFRRSLYDSFAKKKNPKFFIDGRCTSRQGAVFHSGMDIKKLQDTLDDSEESAGCLRQFEKETGVSHVLPQIVAATMLQNFLNLIRGQTSFEQNFFI